MSDLNFTSILENLKEKFPILIQDIKFSEVLNSLLETLQLSSKKKFTFLLVGRTGVGKSSTINTLMGCEVASTSDFEPETMEVKHYEAEINNIQFTVIDTPGLCDSLSEEFDHVYLEMMRSEAKQIDLMWFVTPLNESRVRRDELDGLRLITEAFGKDIWQHAIIVFTCADLVNESKYQETFERRTELIHKAIASQVKSDVLDIPSVAVTNVCETTPDGKKWLGELYVKVLAKISERGALPFFLATAHRVGGLNKTATNENSNNQASSKSKEPNWRFYGDNSSSGFEQEDASTGKASSTPNIELDDKQKKEVRKVIDAAIIPGLAAAGAGIGMLFGPVGAAIGGTVGAGIGLIAWLWE